MSELILRTCRADGTSPSEYANGFRWPAVGEEAVAPDWDSTPECGHGLHGLLRGCGDAGLLDWSADALWIAAEVDEWVEIDGKVKAPRARVVARGDRKAVTDVLVARYPGLPVVGAFATAGDDGTATAGDDGTATAGYRGTATAGYRGTATAGEYGTATAGDDGTATAGAGGEIRIRWWDGTRYRLAVGYVGEDGIEADTPYVVRDGKLTRAATARRSSPAVAGRSEG